MLAPEPGKQSDREVIGKRYIIMALIIALLAIGVQAQSKKTKSRKSKPLPANKYSESKASVASAAASHKEDLERLLPLLEERVKQTGEVVAKKKELLAAGLISKRELDDSEREFAIAQAERDEQRKNIVEADNLIAEAKAAEQLAKLPPARTGGFTTTAALIRYNGSARWAITDIVKVQSFFINRFGRQLPVSAFGQTAVHDRLGFDHRNSVDVAVYPDSPEGQAIMSYLQSAGIPFMAFRQAVAGSATGAHIHIGYPSHRIAP